ncbi:AMP-binding protein [Nocardia nova]|uniref:AMP-binding protein n=1 Tax=Nocardia nova TaxID=37330 RepID=UPI00340A0240
MTTPTAQRGAGESTYVDYCLQALRRRGTDIAFVHHDRTLTGFEALELTARMAAALAARGLTAGAGFAVLAGNCPEAYLIQLAGQTLGARHTGVHPLASADDQAFVLGDAQIHTFVYEPRTYAGRAEELIARQSFGQVFSLGPGPVGEDLLAHTDSADPLEPVARPDDIATIFYTGGTTGRSKGVAHTHRSLVFSALLVQANWEWPADITLLLISPITHAAGQMIAPALARGGQVVLLEKFDPATVLETIESERVSVTFLVPTMLYALLDHPDIGTRDLSSIATIVYGAAPISSIRLQQARARFGEVLLQGYGQTEIGVGALLLAKEDHDPGRPARLSATGRAPAGIDVSIRDDDDAAVPPGGTGEICLRGAPVMSGYWRQPDLTASVLHGGWLHTGDIGSADADGYVTLVDRKKDMIVSGGFNVYPKEVEEALITHPGVKDVAVIGIPDSTWGEAVHAVVEIEPGRPVTADALIAHVRDRKGPVNTPKSFEFVDALPQTALGKIDKKALRQRFWATQARAIH